MNILALDLGTNAGVAVGGTHDDAPFVASTWGLATKTEVTRWHKERLDRRQDPRVTRFFNHLISCKDIWHPTVVVFEDVQFQSYTLQTQLWSSFRTAVWLAFPWRADLTIECVPTGTLKKFATGHGGATKEMMTNALRRQHPKRYKAGMDDNAVDAAWLWLWAKQNLSRIKAI